MKFIDRQKEQQRLKELLHRDSSQFIIVRGRRRIGKSALIGRVLDNDDIYYEADRTAATNQMRVFSQVVSLRFPGFADAIYADWKA